MNGVCVIYDSDEKYAKRLMNVMSNKKSIPYGIQVFTQEQELISYLDHHKPDIMLVSEECYSYEVNQRQDGKVIVLMDEQEDISNRAKKYRNEAVGVFKYQPADKLLSEVIRISNCQEVRDVDQVDVIGIFTPLELSSRTIFSLNLSRALAENHRVLYVSLEEFSGLEEIIPAKENITLSDVVYYYRQNSGHVDQRMMGAVCSAGMVDYIAPVQCADDIAYIEPDQLMELLQQIAANAGYDKIIIDISYAVKQQWKLIRSCNRVYMPIRSDYISQRKIQAFELYFISQGMEKILNMIRKIILPELLTDINKDFWENAEYSEMFHYAKELIKSERVQVG